MEDNIKTYPKYKEIEAPWLLNIPGHWIFDKVKHCFTERVEKGHPNEPLLSSTQTRGVIPQSLYGNRVVSALKDLHLLKLVEVDDFVISLRSFQGGIEYAHYRGIISPAYTVMKAKDRIETPYFRFLAKSVDFIQLLQTCVTGIREGQNIDYKLLKNNYLPIPPSTEQIQIANFLDYENSLINKFIKEKKREIILLKEQKQAEFNQAITRGVNPNAKMKDSGITWIGEIPEHWELKRLKHVATINPSIQEQIKNYDLNDSVVFLAMENISVDGIINNTVKRPIKDVKSGYTSFAKNDVVIAKITPCFENGKGAFLSDLESDIGFGTTELIVLRPNKDILGLYLYYILRSDMILKIGADFMTGSAGQKRIPTNFIRNFRIGIPTVQEQKLIIDTLITKSAQIEKAIVAIVKEIKLIQDYKISLISDVVTGKVDVRNVAVEKIEDVPEEEIEEVEETEELENSEE